MFQVLGCSRKHLNRRGGEGARWDYGISKDIEEKACGNFRGQLENEVKSPGVFKKIRAKFQGVLVFGLEISKLCNTILPNVLG